VNITPKKLKVQPKNSVAAQMAVFITSFLSLFITCFIFCGIIGATILTLALFMTLDKRPSDLYIGESWDGVQTRIVVDTTFCNLMVAIAIISIVLDIMFFLTLCRN
jgi:hypothetical protein